MAGLYGFLADLIARLVLGYVGSLKETVYEVKNAPSIISQPDSGDVLVSLGLLPKPADKGAVRNRETGSADFDSEI